MTTTRLAWLFWSIAALDAIALVAMAIATLGGKGHDGGREMGLFFFVMLPAAVLLVTMLVFAFLNVGWVRYAALSVVLFPALFWVWQQVDDAQIDRRIASRQTGAGHFHGPAMQAMGVAVVARNVETLKRIGPTVDVNAEGNEHMTLLQLAVDRRENGISTRTDAPEIPVVSTLLALGANPAAALEVATKRPDTGLLRLLLEAGGDPNLRLADGLPLVSSWYAVMTPDALRLLGEHGLDPDTKVHDAPMAVVFTIHRRWDLVDVLVDLRADLDRPRADGRNVRSELADQLAEAHEKGQEIPFALQKLARRLGVATPRAGGDAGSASSARNR